MEKIITLTKGVRAAFLQIMDGHSLEYLNERPANFNNNLIWNYGHIIATQQRLCYSLFGLPTLMEEELIVRYQRGTKPEQQADAAEFEKLKELSVKCLERFELDIESGLFKEKTVSFSRLGAEMKTIEEIFSFNFFHEGTHYGYALALKKALVNV